MKFLQQIREYELINIIPVLPKGCKILEIGAGAGWQAKILSERGFQVEAIDIIDSQYRTGRVWPVTLYDGVNIPFPDHIFDVVFSSNVLEHIALVDEFQHEVSRVLKMDGHVIHVVPNACWRFWSLITYYPFFVKRLLSIIFNQSEPSIKLNNGYPSNKKPLEVIKMAFPPRHGAFGNVISEFYWLHNTRWERLFRKNGWIVKRRCLSGLFYSGHEILGLLLSIKCRTKLSRLLGSPCTIFLLQKQ